MHPKDVYILIPRTCTYSTLHGKSDFAHMIKSFEIGRLPGGPTESQGAW